MTSSEGVTVEKIVLKPSWLQDQAEGKRRSSRPLILELVVALLLGVSLLFLSGQPQLLVGLILVLWIGMSILSRVRKNSMRLGRWREKNKSDDFRDMPLEKKSKMMKRALKNREVTQAMIEERLRTLLIQKIKERKNYTDDKIDALLDNPNDLKRVLDDRVLTYFLLNGKRFKDVMRNPSSNSNHSLLEDIQNSNEKDEKYGKWLNQILKKIHDWP